MHISPWCTWAPCHPKHSIGRKRKRKTKNRIDSTPKHLLVADPKPWVPLFPAGVNPKEIPLTTKDLAREMRRKRTERGRQEGKKEGEKLVSGEWEGLGKKLQNW